MTRTRLGYCIKNGKVLTVFKFSGMIGRRFYNKRKVTKGKFCYEKKNQALRKLKKKKLKKSIKQNRFGQEVESQEVVVTTIDTEQAFAINSHNLTQSISANSQLNVTWNVAGFCVL